MEEKINEMLEIINNNCDNFNTQREWLDFNKPLIQGTYLECREEDQEDFEECDNCSQYTPYKWCSLECFCSNVGV